MIFGIKKNNNFEIKISACNLYNYIMGLKKSSFTTLQLKILTRFFLNISHHTATFLAIGITAQF